MAVRAWRRQRAGANAHLQCGQQQARYAKRRIPCFAHRHEAGLVDTVMDMNIGRTFVRDFYQGEPAWAHGHRSNLLDVRNCAAVDTAIITPRDVFEKLGGVDRAAWPAAFAIDYSLRVRRAGLRVAMTPHAVFRRAAGKSRPEIAPEEMARLRAAWSDWLARDPYYNPNFSDRRPGHHVARVSRTGPPT